MSGLCKSCVNPSLEILLSSLGTSFMPLSDNEMNSYFKSVMFSQTIDDVRGSSIRPPTTLFRPTSRTNITAIHAFASIQKSLQLGSRESLFIYHQKSCRSFTWTSTLNVAIFSPFEASKKYWKREEEILKR